MTGFLDKISCRCLERFPSNDCVNPYKKIVILHLKRLQVGRYELLTSFPGVLTSMTLNDFEPSK